MSEYEESDRIRIPELANNSRLFTEAYLYQSNISAPPHAILPAGFPSFTSEADGSLIFTSGRDRGRLFMDSGSDSLLSSSNDYGTLRMTESGDLERLTVRLGAGEEIHFDLQDLLNRNGRFQDGVHGNRTFNEDGSITYLSLDGNFRIVLDRCGKVLSMDLSGKSGYRPSDRRLSTSACTS